mmetsp:Transcript_72322/g.143417  ORF Transcript_72322/g.143417 Transcript_72322/m.143417 type:complete len:111 (-) Transcript_72322:226-558(-)
MTQQQQQKQQWQQEYEQPPKWREQQLNSNSINFTPSLKYYLSEGTNAGFKVPLATEKKDVATLENGCTHAAFQKTVEIKLGQQHFFMSFVWTWGANDIVKRLGSTLRSHG